MYEACSVYDTTYGENEIEWPLNKTRGERRTDNPLTSLFARLFIWWLNGFTVLLLAMKLFSNIQFKYVCVY